jgi:hypothetical protein
MHRNVFFSGKGDVYVMYRKNLSFPIREIPCYDSNCIIGIELKTTNGSNLYILGVYLPSNSNIDSYAQELNVLGNLYCHYLNYGKVIIEGNFNASLIETIGTNERKSQILSSFAVMHNLCIPYLDFDSIGEQFSFVQKKTTLDYILFNKSVQNLLEQYKTYKEGSFSLICDYLSIVATFNLNMKSHVLKNPKTNHSA